MIKVYYSSEDPWPDTVFEEHLAVLPVFMQAKIRAYKDKKEQQERILSKLMLNSLIRELLPSSGYTLTDVTYTGCKKAFLNEKFQFSTSYTKDFVVCAASLTGSIGIDIEQVVPVDTEVLKEYFTGNEWEALRREEFDPSLFYTFWTRKEAVLKAIGKGIFENFNKIEVLEKKLLYEGQPYYIQDIEFHELARLALVSQVKQDYRLERFSVPDACPAKPL